MWLIFALKLMRIRIGSTTLIETSAKRPDPNLKKSQDSRDNMEEETDGGLGVIFALLDPDPAAQINADPDPQPWLKQVQRCNLIKLF